MAKNIKDAVKLAEQLLATLNALSGGGDEAEAPTIPTTEEVAELKGPALKVLAVQFGIDVDGVALKDLKALVTTAAAIINEDDEAPELDDLNALAEAVGVETAKKAAKVTAALKAYFEAEKDEADDEEGEEEDSEEEESEDEESEEEESDEDEEEEEKPASKKKKKAAADEDEEEESEDEDEEESEEESEEEEEEEAVELTAKQVAAYNKVAKKKVKNVAELTKVLVDDEGEPVAWGTPYIKGENAFCCGLPLKDVKHGKKSAGKCLITGKVFIQDDDGDLTEVD